MSRSILPALLAATAVFTAGAAQGEASYPTKPIRVIVPYAAGGVVDVQTRAVTQRMAPRHVDAREASRDLGRGLAAGQHRRARRPAQEDAAFHRLPHSCS